MCKHTLKAFGAALAGIIYGNALLAVVLLLAQSQTLFNAYVLPSIYIADFLTYIGFSKRIAWLHPKGWSPGFFQLVGVCHLLFWSLLFGSLALWTYLRFHRRKCTPPHHALPSRLHSITCDLTPK